MKEYFQSLFDMKKPDGTKKYAPNKFRPLGSIFFMFWRYSGIRFLVTGHRSERSLQVYVANSALNRRNSANSMAVGTVGTSTTTAAPHHRSRDVQPRIESGGGSRRMYNVTINVTNSTIPNLNVVAGGPADSRNDDDSFGDVV